MRRYETHLTRDIGISHFAITEKRGEFDTKATPEWTALDGKSKKKVLEKIDMRKVFPNNLQRAQKVRHAENRGTGNRF